MSRHRVASAAMILAAMYATSCSRPAPQPQPQVQNTTSEQRRIHDEALKSLKETQDQVARMKAHAASQHQPTPTSPPAESTSSKNDR